jgi:hypothetical protein
MNATSLAIAAAAAAAGASVAYAIMSSRRTITYDSSSDDSSCPLPTSSASSSSSAAAPPPLYLPLARDHDGGSPWLPVQPPAHASASRHVIKADALEWLKEQSILPGSVVTSLPDVGELKLSHEQCACFPLVILRCPLTCCRYEPWFQAACDLLFSKVAPGQFAIFYQTDIKMLEEDQV